MNPSSRRLSGTKGERSTSDRVNERLKLALEQEQRKAQVANQSDTTEERAFQQASVRGMRRE
jgi:hypothetical protein